MVTTEILSMRLAKTRTMSTKFPISRMNFPTKNTSLVQRGKARVPERTSLHSFNLLWLMWAVCGGFFITNLLLAVWLTILLKPVFEEPVDTTKVILLTTPIPSNFNIFRPGP